MITQFRGDTEANWLVSSYIPFDRQLVIARRLDGTDRVKFGDGIHTFIELPDLYDATIPTSGGGSAVVSFVQALPLATWIIDHPLGRLPNVQLYVGGKQAETDVDATNTQVVLTFPYPTTGVAIIS